MISNYGIVDTGNDVYSFEICDNSVLKKQNIVDFKNRNTVINVRDYYVARYGDDNDLPEQIAKNVRDNHILPEIIEKQIKLLYGQGPYLYRVELKDKDKIKVPVIDAEIEDWLESWTENGVLCDFRTYLQNCIREFYYTEGVFNKYLFKKSRRINGPLPVLGLECLSSVEVRFATQNKDYLLANKMWDERDFTFFMLGDWNKSNYDKYKIFPRFDETSPLKYPNAISYRKNSSFAEKLYSIPVFYYGLVDWILGSNAASRQLKSFFNNLLTAKYHVKIPGAWVEKKRETLKDIIEQNKELHEVGLQMIVSYNGVELIMDGKPVSYSETYISDIINFELRKLTDLMSGADNAGKLWSTIKYNDINGVEEWEIVEIPLQIKNFVDSILSYKKEAVNAILEGKGVDASLTNVSKDGIISQSGANVYYNYLIYLNSLQIPEEICTYDINKAIRLNFPNKKDIKLGFYHNIPVKQQETTPSDRMTNKQNP